MNFKRATDELLSSVTLEDLAAAMGISVQAIRQARASETSTAYRAPPGDWERYTAKLAAKQAKRLLKLAGELDREQRKK